MSQFIFKTMIPFEVTDTPFFRAEEILETIQLSASQVFSRDKPSVRVVI